MYKTVPFPHQKEWTERTRETKARGLFWEPGVAKTKPILDTAAHLFREGEIDALLVVAPNGVQRNWISDEFAAHMPDDVAAKTRAMYWETKKAKTKAHVQAAEAVLRHEGLAFLSISYSAFMTDAGKNFVWRFLKNRRVLYVLDEVHNIKTPNAKRTKSIVMSGKYGIYRRVLTGTLNDECPFDAYSPVKFLDPDFWVQRGVGSPASFRSYFGVYKTRGEVMLEKGYDPGYDELMGYRNLHVLKKWLAEIGDKLTKDEAGLVLPEKLYSKRYFDLTPEQARMYAQLREEFLTWLDAEAAERGEGIVEAELAITRLLRLQQITCGYVTTNMDEPVKQIPGDNPRLDLLMEEADNLPHQAIIWARFRADIDQITKALGKKAVRYDGALNEDECERSKLAFKSGEAQFFVSNPAKGGEGLTLTEARTVLYYSNSFKILERIQSENRAHRPGQKHPVHYIDLVARGTVDESIIEALVRKQNTASIINGTEIRKWL